MSTHTLTITFHSDWTIGTGHGTDGFIDVAVKRDHRGLPIVEAGYLLGLWRDSCESVADAFDVPGASSRPWHDAVDRLFGRAGVRGAGLLQAENAHLRWADFLSSGSDLASMYAQRLVVHRSSTAIDDRGVARADTLRVREAVRAGTVLTASVNLHAHPDWEPSGIPWQVQFLLAAGLGRLRHLSGKRRRGAGRCTVSCADWDVATLFTEHLCNDQVDLVADPPALAASMGTLVWPEPPSAMIHRPSASPDFPTNGQWRRRLRYTIELLEPVVATKRVVGNTIECLDYIPGAYLLPILARAIGATVGPLIRDAHFVVTPAHVDLGGETSRTPQTWLAGDKGQAWKRDGSHPGEGHDAWVNNGLPSNAKAVRGWSHDGVIGDVPRWLTGHAVIDNQKQRPGENGLYALQEIPAGLMFSGEVCDDGSLDGHAKALLSLDDTLQRLGRGRKLRGLARIRIVEVKDNESTSLPEMIGAQSLVRIQLLTDTVLLDEFGVPQPTATALVKELGRLVGVGATLHRARVTVVRTESWNTAHGLPRPSVLALEGGSVVECYFANAVPRSALEHVLIEGIGELRVEGYGRLGLLGETVPRLQEYQAESTAQQSLAEPTDQEWGRVRRAIASDELRERCRLAGLSGTIQQEWFPKGLPAGFERALRTAARSALRDESIEPLKRWCARVGTPAERCAENLLKHNESAKELLGGPTPDDLWKLKSSVVIASFLLAYAQASHWNRKEGAGHGAHAE